MKPFFLPIPKQVAGLASAVFSLSLYSVLLLVFKVLQPDLDEHIFYSNEIPDKLVFPGHPLFFLSIQLFSGFSKILIWQIWVAAALFSLAQWTKIMLSIKLIEVVFNSKLNYFQFALLMLAQLVICFSVFDKSFIINYLSPNYFHNGTLNISIPLSLWLFIESLQYCKTEARKHLVNMFMAGAFIILTKPSFLFCFIPVFPLYVFSRFGFSKILASAFRVDAFFLALLIWQSIYLILLPPSPDKTFSVDFMPFYLFGDNLGHLKAFFGGLAIPLFVLLIFGFKPFKHPVLYFALAMLALGYIFAFTMVDTVNGVRYPNMTWQVPILLYFLIVLLIGSIFSIKNPPRLWQLLAILFFVFANALYGMYYLKVAISIRSLFI